MRQAKREITKPAELKKVLTEAQVCHLAFNVAGSGRAGGAVGAGGTGGTLNNAAAAPYIVTLNYGFDFCEDMGSNDRPVESLTSCLADTLAADLTFGCKTLTLWFHCAHEGLKLDLLAQNNRVGFQMETGLQLCAGKPSPTSAAAGQVLQACLFTMDYESIVGAGRLQIVSDEAERLHGLKRLMAHYGGEDLEFAPTALARTTVLRLDAESFTGKRNKK